MKVFWVYILFVFGLVAQGSVSMADDFTRSSSASVVPVRPNYARSFRRDRVNIYNYDGYRGPIHHTGPVFSPAGPSKCFPFGCGGIEGPFRNPNPDARASENLTSCIYNASNVLVYEREGKLCPLNYIDRNTTRLRGRQ